MPLPIVFVSQFKIQIRVVAEYTKIGFSTIIVEINANNFLHAWANSSGYPQFFFTNLTFIFVTDSFLC